MVSQVVHIPTLSFMSHLFQITYLSDASDDAMKHCQSKVAGKSQPKTTRDPEELCSSPEVDLVFIASSDTDHKPHALLGLKHGKHVFIEKPITLSLKDTDAIIEAEKASKGSVFVGYMRRYSSAFVDALKEVGSIESIRYARVRDIIGSNSIFIPQSGTFPLTFNDYRKEDSNLLSENTQRDIKQALEVELGVPVTKERATFWQLLSGLGSHDLSAMRELLGMPTGVLGASVSSSASSPFWR